MRFRRKTEVVEAIKYQAGLGNNRMMNWLAQQEACVRGWSFHDGRIEMPSQPGKGVVVDGDWIIRTSAGHFHARTASEFEACFEPAP